MTVGMFPHCGFNAGQKAMCVLPSSVIHTAHGTFNSSVCLVCSSHLEAFFGVKPDFWGKLWSYMFCSLYGSLSAQNS